MLESHLATSLRSEVFSFLYPEFQMNPNKELVPTDSLKLRHLITLRRYDERTKWEMGGLNSHLGRLWK